MDTKEKKTILLVEDEVVIAFAEAQTIKKFGYDVMTASSGEKAIELATMDNKADLILMDIDLGRGINGPGAALQILRKRTLPIVFLTSHAEREMVEKVRGITRYGYVIKNSGDFVLQSSIEMAFELFETHQRLENELTERKRAERALSESEERYRNLLDVAPIGIAVHSKGKVVFTNHAGLRILGAKSFEQIIGKPIEEIIHPANLEISRNRSRRMQAGETGLYPAEDIYVRLDGTAINVEVIAAPLLYDGEQASQVLVTDITERRRAEEALAHERALLRNVIDNLPDPLYVKDLQGRKIVANLAEAHFSGKETVEEVLGKTDVDLYPGDMAVRSAMEEEEIVRTGNPLRNYESSFTTPDGKKHWQIGGKVLLKDAKGNPMGILGITHEITERKLAEEALAQSELRFRSVWDKSADGMRLTDRDGRIVEVNNAYCALVKIPREELLGRVLSVVYRVERPDDDLRLYHKRFDAGEVISNDIVHAILWNDEEIFLDVSISYIEAAGHGRLLLCLFRDVSMRKRMEEALRESEQKYRTYIDQSPEGIFIVDAAGHYLDVNATTCSMLGYAREELLSLSIRDINADVDAAVSSSQFLHLKETGHLNSEMRLRKKNGEKVPVSMNAVRLPNGTYMAFCADITERKRTEQLLQESEERHRTISMLTTDYIFRVSVGEDGEAMIDSISDNYPAITGRALSEVARPESWLQIIHPEDQGRLMSILHALVTEGGDGEIECRSFLHNGQQRWVQVMAHANRSPANEKTRTIIGSVKDITERKRNEENIKNLLHEKDLLLQEVHHRIKNNMMIVMSLLRLQADALQDPASKIALRDAGNRIRSMHVLYEKLYRSENFGQVSMREYFSHLLDQIAGTFPRRDQIKIEKHIGDFMLDAGKLSSLGIIVNELLTNSMKHAFETRDNGLIFISASMEGRHATVIVQDDGSGIPESITTAATTGFGLQLIDMLTKQLDGRIRIERGNGTKFILEFET